MMTSFVLPNTLYLKASGHARAADYKWVLCVTHIPQQLAAIGYTLPTYQLHFKHIFELSHF